MVPLIHKVYIEQGKLIKRESRGYQEQEQGNEWRIIASWVKNFCWGDKKNWALGYDDDVQHCGCNSYH